MAGWNYAMALVAVVAAALSGCDAFNAWDQPQAGGAVGAFAAEPLPTAQRAIVLSGSAKGRLTFEPLDAAAMRDLSIARARLVAGDAMAPLLLAESVTRRDIPTEGLLLDRAARDGDLEGTLRRYDILLSVWPEVRTQLMPRLVAGLASPAIRSGLERYAGRPWFDPLLQVATSASPTPLHVAALATAVGRLQRTGPDDPLTPALLSAFLARGDVAGARNFVAGLPGGSHAASDMALTPKNATHRLAPLAWTLADDEALRVDWVGNNTVRVSVRPDSRRLALSRKTLLAAGRYNFVQTIAYDTPPHARLSWKVTCTTPADRLVVWQQVIPARTGRVTYRSQVAIPPDCTSQFWQLYALGGGGQLDAVANIGPLHLSGD